MDDIQCLNTKNVAHSFYKAKSMEEILWKKPLSCQPYIKYFCILMKILIPNHFGNLDKFKLVESNRSIWSIILLIECPVHGRQIHIINSSEKKFKYCKWGIYLSQICTKILFFGREIEYFNYENSSWSEG